jgi:hypothetical protein
LELKTFELSKLFGQEEDEFAKQEARR